MSNLILSGIGEEIAVSAAIPPALYGAGTTTSAAIDRLAGGIAKNSCVLSLQTGAVAGAPDSLTVDAKVQHCDTSGGSYVDWKPDGTAPSGAIAQITAASKRGRKSIDLKGAKQFIKVVQVAAFVNGTSPTVAAAAQLIMGGADVLPAEADGTV